jgi:hypothetical protein
MLGHGMFLDLSTCCKVNTPPEATTTMTGHLLDYRVSHTSNQVHGHLSCPPKVKVKLGEAKDSGFVDTHLCSAGPMSALIIDDGVRRVELPIM